LVWDGAEYADALARGELPAQRPVAEESQGSLVDPIERVCESEDVLARNERTDAEVGGRPVRRGLHAEAVEVDAARDDLDLPARLGQLELELAAEILRDGDDRRGAADDKG